MQVTAGLKSFETHEIRPANIQNNRGKKKAIDTKVESLAVEKFNEPQIKIPELFQSAINGLKSAKLTPAQLIFYEMIAESTKFLALLPPEVRKLRAALKQLPTSCSLLNLCLTKFNKTLLAEDSIFIYKDEILASIIYTTLEFSKTLEEGLLALSKEVPLFNKSAKGAKLHASVNKMIAAFQVIVERGSQSYQALVELGRPLNDFKIEMTERSAKEWIQEAKKSYFNFYQGFNHIRLLSESLMIVNPAAHMGLGLSDSEEWFHETNKFFNHYLKMKALKPSDIKVLQKIIFKNNIQPIELCCFLSQTSMKKREKNLQDNFDLNPYEQAILALREISGPYFYIFIANMFDSVNHSLLMALESLILTTRKTLNESAFIKFIHEGKIFAHWLRQQCQEASLGEEALEPMMQIMVRLEAINTKEISLIFLETFYLLSETENLMDLIFLKRGEVLEERFRIFCEITERAGSVDEELGEAFLHEVFKMEELNFHFSNYYTVLKKIKKEIFYFNKVKIVKTKKKKMRGVKPSPRKSKPKKGPKNGNSRPKAKEQSEKSQFEKNDLNSVVIEEKSAIEKVMEGADKEKEGKGTLEIIFNKNKEKVLQSIKKVNSARKLSDDTAKEFISPRNVNWKDLFSELKQAGWEMVKNSKSGHAQFVLPKRRDLGRVTVPVSKGDTSIKVVRGIRDSIEAGKERAL